MGVCWNVVVCELDRILNIFQSHLLSALTTDVPLFKTHTFISWTFKYYLWVNRLGRTSGSLKVLHTTFKPINKEHCTEQAQAPYKIFTSVPWVSNIRTHLTSERSSPCSVWPLCHVLKESLFIPKQDYIRENDWKMAEPRFEIRLSCQKVSVLPGR